jgi:hypothetical protein
MCVFYPNIYIKYAFLFKYIYNRGEIGNALLYGDKNYKNQQLKAACNRLHWICKFSKEKENRHEVHEHSHDTLKINSFQILWYVRSFHL